MRSSAEAKDPQGLLSLRLRGGALICGVGLMVLVPVAALNSDRPSPLGWQMYASAVDLPQINVVLSDGSRQERNIGGIASGFRPEIDYVAPVARFLCASEDNVESIEMTRAYPPEKVIIQCTTF